MEKQKKGVDDMDIDAMSEEGQEEVVDMGGSQYGWEGDGHRFEGLDLEYINKGKSNGKGKKGGQKGMQWSSAQYTGSKGAEKGRSKGPSKGTGKGKGGVVCHNCGQPGHVAQECPDANPYIGL